MSDNDQEFYDQAMDIAHGEQGEQEEPEAPDESEEKALVPANHREPSPWDQVMAEWDAPLVERMLLVRSMQEIDGPIVELVTATARRYGLPISGVNLIPTKDKKTGATINRVYINSEGIRWRLYVDKRGFRGSGGTITHMPTDGEPWISATARVEMADGSWAENIAVKEWPITDPTDKDRNFSLGNMCKKLITQAKRRAGADLVGTGLPIYDEYYGEIVEGDFVIEPPKELKPAKKVPDSKPSLLSMAQELDEYWDVDTIAELAGVDNIWTADIDIEEIWERIKEHEKGSGRAGENSEEAE